MGSAADGRRLGCVRRESNQSIREEEWTDMLEPRKEVSETIGVSKAGQTVAGLGRLAWRRALRGDFASAKEERVQAHDRRSVLRVSLLSIWRVDLKILKCVSCRGSGLTTPRRSLFEAATAVCCCLWLLACPLSGVTCASPPFPFDCVLVARVALKNCCKNKERNHKEGRSSARNVTRPQRRLRRVSNELQRSRSPQRNTTTLGRSDEKKFSGKTQASRRRLT